MNSRFLQALQRFPYNSLLMAIIVALSSQLYMHMFIEGFRISIAVVLLPVLLLTVGEGRRIPLHAAITAVIVFLFRTLILYLTGIHDWAVLRAEVVPNMVFYLVYGLTLRGLLTEPERINYPLLLPQLLIADFMSNVIELCITEIQHGSEITPRMGLTLLMIGVIRSTMAWLILLAFRQYRDILELNEQKKRYQSLFMMITGLKNEIYFMKKNSEEIEAVMGHAYRMHEQLEELEVPPEIRQMSLSIARDVHEVKKDYLRIIRGIQEEIGDDSESASITIQELVTILQDTSRQLLMDQQARIRLDFQVNDDLATPRHYELMAVLKNVVGNAMEAIIEQWPRRHDRPGTITLREQEEDGYIVFRIKDDGPGISPRHRKHIFRMGYSTKFDPATGNIYRGVGLYGVKMTVEETFGGTIEVNSEENLGTEFMIRIPRSNLEVTA